MLRKILVGAGLVAGVFFLNEASASAAPSDATVRLGESSSSILSVDASVASRRGDIAFDLGPVLPPPPPPPCQPGICKLVGAVGALVPDPGRIGFDLGPVLPPPPPPPCQPGICKLVGAVGALVPDRGRIGFDLGPVLPPPPPPPCQPGICKLVGAVGALVPDPGRIGFDLGPVLPPPPPPPCQPGICKLVGTVDATVVNSADHLAAVAPLRLEIPDSLVVGSVEVFDGSSDSTTITLAA